MRYYAVSQWLIFFFIYCFLGWIWECCYVSVRKHKWVNRGFLHGPFLPIYGSGAIVILISTIAVKDIVPLVFLLGMVSSTILEFCTGCCMEKLFGVRYWDYSNLPLNFKGHICFFISLAWGAFSILLVCVIHKPIEAAVLMIPRTIADIIAVVLAIYMAADFAVSINEAMDLKATLEKFTRMNSFRCMPEEWRLRPHLQKKNLIRKRNNSWQQWLKKEDSYLRERIEDTAILQVLLREILMLFREYIKNLLMKSKKLLLKEGQRRVINVGKDIVI